MQETRGESLEVVLDNRKLIVGFSLLMVICASFFIYGFIEGKRQVLQSDEGQRDSVLTTTSKAGESPGGAVNAQESKAAEDRSIREQLEWYKSLNKGETGAKSTPVPAEAKEEEAPTPVKSVPAAPTPPKVAAEPGPVSSPAMSYSVQVGAFRDLRSAESRGEALKQKGYNYVIDPPRSGEEYFLLKVGRFDTRAEAVAMQLKLKNDGFPTLIKTNP